MIKRLSIAAAAVLMAACATTQTAIQPYRAPGAVSSVLVSGQLSSGMASYTLHLLVSGAAVASGDLDAAGSGILQGTWDGKPVVSDCAGKTGFWSGATTVRCHVTIAGEHAATLQFSPE